MPKRLNPGFILVGVGGSVSMIVRDRIYHAAKVGGVSPSGYIGKILSDYAETLPALQMEVDPRQGKLFGKLDTTEELLEQRRKGKEPPKEVVGFGEGNKLTQGVLAKKVKFGSRRAKPQDFEGNVE